MQFGRVQDPSGVDFELPPLTPRSAQLLARAQPQACEWLRLGAPVWGNRDWVGTLYPPGSSAQDRLRLYAEKLRAIELNSMFYALPSDATLERWAAATPRHFRFCPKVPRAISHELHALPAAELRLRVRTFVSRVRRLGERLGPTLLQLPEALGPQQLAPLTAALSEFPEGFALALELRHAAWFTDGGRRETLLRLLEQRQIATVITDVAGRRDVCHAALTTPLAFVRFVGEGGHPSDQPRTEAWLARLAEWRALGLESAYFFVHQPDDILAPQLLAFAAQHARARGLEVPSVQLESRPSAQLGLFG
jgi:uncharacterized protein YecE (DUF72 family)